MNTLVLLALLAQEPARDPMVYLRAHREADAALVAGRLDEARSGMLQCLRWSPGNATVAYALACTEARVGRTEAALDWLERAAQWGYADDAVAKWDGDLASVREQLRFTKARLILRRNAPSEEAASLVAIWDERTQDGNHSVAVHPRGTRVAVGRCDGVIQLLDGRTGMEVRRSPDLGNEVWALDFDRAGDHLAALTWDGKLHFWPVDGSAGPITVDALGPPEAGDAMPFGSFLQFDPTGERVLVAGTDRGGSLWTAKGEHLHTWFEPLGSFFQVCLAWSADGERIAMPKGAAVHLVNGRTGAPDPAPLECPAPITSVAFQPGGTLLATGDSGGLVRTWDLTTRKSLLEHAFPIPWTGDDLEVSSLAFSMDGRRLAAGTGETAYVRVLDMDTGKLLHEHDWGGGHWGEPFLLRWNADASRLWFTFSCAATSLNEIRMHERMPASIQYHGQAPCVSRPGLAVGFRGWSVLSIDGKSGRCLWDRPHIGGGVELLKTATGHFTTEAANLDGIQFDSGCEGEEPRPLADAVELLFDPKRVRAAREGVALAPVRF